VIAHRPQRGDRDRHLYSAGFREEETEDIRPPPPPSGRWRRPSREDLASSERRARPGKPGEEKTRKRRKVEDARRSRAPKAPSEVVIDSNASTSASAGSRSPNSTEDGPVLVARLEEAGILRGALDGKAGVYTVEFPDDLKPE